MPVIKCPSCGFVADYGETSNCVQCSGFVIVKEKGKLAVTGKTAGLVIFMLLILGGAVYGVTRYFSVQSETTRIEAEKKQLESFDYVTFDADAESVSKTIETLPAKFKSPPPSVETIRRTIGELVAQKTETKRIEPSLSDDNAAQDKGSVPVEQIRIYSLKDIEPLQYDYVKGKDGKLVCFVNYRAVIRITERQETPERSIETPLPENIVRETARYDLESGTWTIKQAGLSEQSRKAEIDKARLEAKDMEPR
jgi:hypothetical protein